MKHLGSANDTAFFDTDIDSVTEKQFESEADEFAPTSVILEERWDQLGSPEYPLEFRDYKFLGQSFAMSQNSIR